MAYRIVYGKENKTRKKKVKWKILVAVGAVALILAGRFLGWGAFLIPGDAAVTVVAMETLIADLGAGTKVREAFGDFCREIMAHGTLY